jgi:alpha-beta hydrolase superfamily lysophospholipase
MGEIKTTNWTVPGSDGHAIYGDTHWPEGGPIGVLICCHGFKGYKDYGFFPLLCDHAAARGLVAVRFNFSHSGMTNRVETFEHPELFEQDRWGRQVEDLRTVYEHTNLPADLPRVVFGHSRGGVTSTLFAGRTAPEQLTGLITAAAPDYACKMDDLVRDQLRAEGRLLSPSGRTGQDLYVGLGWLEEIENDPEWFDPVRAAANIACPLLVLHGDADDTVAHACAKRLCEVATQSELAIIPGANHVFNSPNPLSVDTPADALPQATAELIERSLVFAETRCRTADS